MNQSSVSVRKFKASPISGFTLLILACIFIPSLFLGLVAMSLLCAIIWFVDSLVRKAVSATESSKIHAVSEPSVTVLSEERRTEIIEAALAETRRQMAHVVCSDRKFREKYFETVFTRLCERQGVKVNKFFWKKIEG